METRTKARAVRADATAAEIRLWRAISARKVAGARFNRQVPIGLFICGFVSRARLVLEVDRGQHAVETDNDAARTKYLERNRVIRFWNSDVLGNLDGVMAKIERALAALPSPHPTRQREGSF